MNRSSAYQGDGECSKEMPMMLSCKGKRHICGAKTVNLHEEIGRIEFIGSI